MKRKYRGAQRVALIREEVAEAIKELSKMKKGVDCIYHNYWIDLYYRAQWFGAKKLAEKLKEVLKSVDPYIEQKLDYRAWRSRDGIVHKTSEDYQRSWNEVIKKPFGDWTKTEKEEKENNNDQ